jgi:hypothetical protein
MQPEVLSAVNPVVVFEATMIYQKMLISKRSPFCSSQLLMYDEIKSA